MRSLRRAQRGFEHGAVLGLLAAVVGFLFFAMLSIRGARIEAQLLLAVAGGIFVGLGRKGHGKSCEAAGRANSAHAPDLGRTNR